MSINDTNHLGALEDSYAGPTTGFWENAKAAYDQQFRVDSFSALEAEASEAWMPSIRAYERLTGQSTKLAFGDATMRTYISELMGEKTPWYTDMGPQFDAQARANFREVNEQIKALNDPNIKSLDQVVQDIIKMRQEVSGNTADVADRQSWAGWLGSFAGGIAGSFTTRDPLQLLSLGFGGFGKNVATRLATEMGIAGTVEAGQQFIAVEPTRELLGEQPGSPWESIIYSALGAGIIRGGLEGAGALVGRAAGRTREGVGGVNLDDMDFSDAQLRSMFERQNTPTARAGLHALEAQEHFNVLNPYTPSDAGMRRFIGELSEVQDIVRGKTDTAIRQLPIERLPVDLDDLSFEMRQVKETEPQVFDRFTAAQTRLDEIDQQIAAVETQLSAINEADGLARIDPDTAELARSYINDLEGPNATPAARETARRQLNAIAETIGPERIAKETADAGIAPRQDLKTLRKSRKAVMKEFKQARNDVDARIEHQRQSARLKEMMEQRKSAAELGLYAKQNAEPYVGPLMDHSTVEGTYQASAAAQETIPVAARNITETPDGMIDLGEGKLVPADFELEIEGQTMTIRSILEDLDEDDKLVTAMGQCAL